MFLRISTLILWLCSLCCIERAYCKPAPVLDVLLRPDSRPSLLLRRAHGLIQRGEHEEAFKLVNEAFVEDPQALVSLSGEHFIPISRVCRDLLKLMPEQVLTAQRMLIDPVAQRELKRWAEDPNDVRLAQLYRDSFFSMFGDNAAFLLACSYLDHGRYREAKQVLTNLVTVHPNSDIKATEIWPRLSLAAHRSGDRRAAVSAWKHFATLPERPAHWDELGKAISQSEEELNAAPRGLPTFGQQLGSESTWIVKWTKRTPGAAGHTGGTKAGIHRMQREKRFTYNSVAIAGRNAIHRGQKTSLVDLETGIQAWAVHGRHAKQGNYFGETRHGWEQRALSAGQGVVCSLKVAAAMHMQLGYKPNTLSCWDITTGARKWDLGSGSRYRRPKEGIGGNPQTSKGKTSWLLTQKSFRSAPIPWRDYWFFAYEDKSGLILAAIDIHAGVPRWQARLFATVPGQGGVIRMATDATQVYICTGDGSVAAVNARTGNPAWFHRNKDQKLSETGWEDSSIHLAGDTVVTFPQQSSSVCAYDKWTGKRLWKTKKAAGTSYCMGGNGQVLVVAGRTMARGLDLASGNQIWTRSCNMSFGRGFISSESFFVPDRRSVIKCSLLTGAPQATLTIITPSGLPVTDIVPYQNDLLVVGLDTLYRVEDVTAELKEADIRLAAKPTGDDYLRRGEVRAGLGSFEGAASDLTEALKLLGDESQKSKAKELILSCLPHLQTPLPLFELMHGHGFLGKQLLRLCWLEAQHIEETDKPRAFALYRKALSVPESIDLKMPGDSNLHCKSRYAIWSRIARLAEADQTLKNRLGAVCAEMQQLAKSRMHTSPELVIELANLQPDLIDDEMCSHVVEQLTRSGTPGLAAQFCQRIMVGCKDASKARFATIEYMRLMGKRLPFPDLVKELQRIKERDPQWYDTVLVSTLQQLGIQSHAPKFEGQGSRFELAWRAEAGILAGVTNNGCYFYKHRSREAGVLDLKTGKSRMLKVDLGATFVSSLRKPIVVSSDGYKARFADSISGKEILVVDGLLYAYQRAESGFFPVKSRAAEGMFSLVDPILGTSIWQRHGLNAIVPHWIRTMVQSEKRNVYVTTRIRRKIQDLVFTYPTGEMQTRPATRRKDNRQGPEGFAAVVTNGILKVTNQEKVIYELPTSGERRLWWNVVANCFNASLPDGRSLILQLDGTSKIEKPLFLGDKLGDTPRPRVVRSFGKLFLCPDRLRRRGGFVSRFRILDPSGTVRDKYLPFAEHAREGRYVHYDVYAVTRDLVVLGDRRSGDVLAYRLTKAN